VCLRDSRTRESEKERKKKRDRREGGIKRETENTREREGETERIRDRKNIYSLKYDDVIIDLSQKRVAEKGIGRERKTEMKGPQMLSRIRSRSLLSMILRTLVNFSLPYHRSSPVSSHWSPPAGHTLVE
jgi:hypothetical protein